MPSTRVLDAIEAIVDYNWSDEARDFEEQEETEGHIFRQLREVQEWITTQRGRGTDDQLVTIVMPSGRRHQAQGHPDLIVAALQSDSEVLCEARSKRETEYILRATNGIEFVYPVSVQG